MLQERSPAEVQAEAGSEETREFVLRVRRATRRKFTPAEKVRIVIEGFRGQARVSESCRREGIKPNVYYAWLKDVIEEGTIVLRGSLNPADLPAAQAALVPARWAGAAVTSWPSPVSLLCAVLLGLMYSVSIACVTTDGLLGKRRISRGIAPLRQAARHSFA